MAEELDRSYDFTRVAWDKMYDAVDSSYFQEMDAELIYRALEKELKPVTFGDYLRRYIYKKTGMEGSFRDVPLRDYQMIILDAFRDNHTPASFTPTTAKLSALSRNWLTQQTVKRQVVLLLGFGLGMSAEDVNMFLYKALHEQALNTQDPFEMICLYCYEHGYGYYKYEQLWKIYEQMTPENLDMKLIYEGQAVGRPESVQSTQDDARLMTYLLSLKGGDGATRAAENAWRVFGNLYDQAREIVAEVYNQESRENTDLYVRELREQLDRNDRLYEEEKVARLKRAEDARKVWTKEDITESDLEHILCSAIPTDHNGNLTPAKKSTLYGQFEGKRVSRKRMNELLHRRTEVDRFDLITLNFLIHAERVDQQPNARKRYIRFIETTNQLLKDCGMGPLYVANPYECFVLMCILSVSPLETYADVMEMSYDRES